MRPRLTAVVGAVNLLAALVTIAVAFWPGSREWLLQRAALGWIAAVAFYLISAILLQWMLQQRAEYAKCRADWSKEVADAVGERDKILAELNMRQASVDPMDEVPLREWLDGWSPNSEFVSWLRNGFSGFYMSVDRFMYMQKRAEALSSDPRKLRNPTLALLFSKVLTGLNAFNAATAEMWIEGNHRLEIPSEWKYEQPERWERAYKALCDTSNDLEQALDALFIEMHNLEIRFIRP